MARKYIDCREYPSESKCTLALSADSDDELLEAAVQHAVTVHGHEDSLNFFGSNFGSCLKSALLLSKYDVAAGISQSATAAYISSRIDRRRTALRPEPSRQVVVSKGEPRRRKAIKWVASS
jgi:predicted small metal-binding protein